MSLRRALDRLPHDRRSRAALKGVLAMVRHHPDEWIDPVRAARILGLSDDLTGHIFAVLAECFVLDFDDGTGRYLYRTDKLTEIEIERFVRSAESSTGRLQSNVEKFRQRRHGDQ